MKLRLLIILVAVAAAAKASPLPDDYDAAGINFNIAQKRGIAFNDASVVKLFDYPGSKVAWMYNWASKLPITGTVCDYVPMLHSNQQGMIQVWADDVDDLSKINAGRLHVLSFNEPEQCGGGGACMPDVQSTAALHKALVDPLRNYGNRMRIISPSVTNGVFDGGHIMGIGWLKQFMAACNDCKIDAVAIHWYDSWNNVEYFKKHVQEAHDAFGKDVWISEFGATGTVEQKISFLKQVLPWLDAQPWVYRYAVQMASRGELVNADGTGLSELGLVYNTY